MNRVVLEHVDLYASQSMPATKMTDSCHVVQINEGAMKGEMSGTKLGIDGRVILIDRNDFDVLVFKSIACNDAADTTF